MSSRINITQLVASEGGRCWHLSTSLLGSDDPTEFVARTACESTLTVPRRLVRRATQYETNRRICMKCFDAAECQVHWDQMALDELRFLDVRSHRSKEPNDD